MQMVSIDIGDGFPVKLLCLMDGTVMLSPMGMFPLIVEDIPQGVSSIFESGHFSLREQGQSDYQIHCYNLPYHYKQLPTLKAWLVQQLLVNPFEATDDSEEEKETP